MSDYVTATANYFILVVNMVVGPVLIETYGKYVQNQTKNTSAS